VYHARIRAIECTDVPGCFKLIDDPRRTRIANPESALQERGRCAVMLVNNTRSLIKEAVSIFVGPSRGG
jgi:hypothetical protein